MSRPFPQDLYERLLDLRQAIADVRRQAHRMAAAMEAGNGQRHMRDIEGALRMAHHETYGAEALFAAWARWPRRWGVSAEAPWTPPFEGFFPE